MRVVHVVLEVLHRVRTAIMVMHRFILSAATQGTFGWYFHVGTNEHGSELGVEEAAAMQRRTTAFH